MVNKTESFFRTLNNPSLPSSPSPPTAPCDLLLSSSHHCPPNVKRVTSPFPLVNRCDGTEEEKKEVLYASGLLSLFSAWVPFHLMSLDAAGAQPQSNPPTPHFICWERKHKGGNQKRKKVGLKLIDPPSTRLTIRDWNKTILYPQRTSASGDTLLA